MKAMRYHGFGGPELLREDDVPAPRPAAGEVLVEVAGTCVNPADWKVGEGMLRGIIDYPVPFIAGFDFSGTIRQLGADVEGLQVGDAVFGAMPINRMGTYAEQIVVPAAVVAGAPKSIPLATAGAVPTAALTAWFATQAPQHAAIQPGQRVLIHGGAGGTGMFAVQFARWRGAHVLATTSGANVEFLRSLGVQEPIDYRAQRYDDVAGQVDAVVDLVGSEVHARSFPLLRRGGVITSIVAPPDPGLAERYGVRATVVDSGPPRDPGTLKQIAQLIDDGLVRIEVSAQHPLSAAAAAMTESRQGHTRGKILLVVNGAWSTKR